MLRQAVAKCCRPPERGIKCNEGGTAIAQPLGGDVNGQTFPGASKRLEYSQLAAFKLRASDPGLARIRRTVDSDNQARVWRHGSVMNWNLGTVRLFTYTSSKSSDKYPVGCNHGMEHRARLDVRLITVVKTARTTPHAQACAPQPAAYVPSASHTAQSW
jgi:hypothetical protein